MLPNIQRLEYHSKEWISGEILRVHCMSCIKYQMVIVERDGSHSFVSWRPRRSPPPKVYPHQPYQSLSLMPVWRIGNPFQRFVERPIGVELLDVYIIRSQQRAAHNPGSVREHPSNNHLLRNRRQKWLTLHPSQYRCVQTFLPWSS